MHGKFFIVAFILLGVFAVFGQQIVEFTPEYPSGTILDMEVPPYEAPMCRPSYFFAPMETDSVELAWDNGSPAGYVSWISTGDIEAIRYAPEHPCSIYSVSFYMSGAGISEIHIWEDWSGYPNTSVSGDLVPCIYLNCPMGAGWREVDVEAASGHKVYIPAKVDFQIGQVYSAGGPLLQYASNYTSINSHVYDVSSGTWYYIGDGSGAHPYMIRAKGIYFDIDTVKQFTDVTTDIGLNRGRTLAWVDYDNDGWDDLICTDTLYHNEGDGTFTNTGFCFGGRTAMGDFTGDGWLDAVTVSKITSVSDTVDTTWLWRNNGDGTFTEIGDSLGYINYNEPKNCGGFGDMNGDGWLDLYMSYWEHKDSIGNNVWHADHLYKNVAGTLFVEVTDSFAPIVKSSIRYSRGIHFCDYDTDGDQDIYISCYRLLPNYFLINNGGGYYTDEAIARGVAGHYVSGAYGHTIGSVWCDFDNDGDFDLICANLAHPRYISFSDKTYIYQNNGDGTFTDLFPSSGVYYYETHSSPAVGDYDNDGNLDLYISSTYSGMHSWIYKGNGDGTFTLDNYKSGVWTDNGWGAAWSDYDHDGDLDLAVSTDGSALQLYRNDVCLFENNWVQLNLFYDTVPQNYFAYGAQARLYLADGRILSRCIQGNTGVTTCMDSRTMHFGMGDVTVADSLVILWPPIDSRGAPVRQTFANFATDKWRYDIYASGTIDTTAGVSENKRALPAEIAIHAYPNPFNSSVTLELEGVGATFRSPGQIGVEIFDINGRLVGNLPLSSAGTEGSSEDPTPVVWQPDKSITSGVYLVRAKFADKSVTKRVVYLK